MMGPGVTEAIENRVQRDREAIAQLKSNIEQDRNQEEPTSFFGKIGAFVTKLIRRPGIAHILRMSTRYGNRTGSLYSGALTYFSVLALVPILMFAFSVLGMVLTVFRPELMDISIAWIRKSLNDVGQVDRIVALIEQFFTGWRGVGVVALLTALYAGVNWMTNLRQAMFAVCQPSFGMATAKHNFLVQKLIDMAVLLGFLFAVGLMGVSSVAGSTLAPTVLGFLHLDHLPGVGWIVFASSLAVSLLAFFLLFLYIYKALPRTPFNKRAYLLGSFFAAVLTQVLIQFVPKLIGIFQSNKAVQLFGSMIVVMLMLNLFAQIILYMGAWIATANQPAVDQDWTDADFPLLYASQDEILVDPGHWEYALEDYLESKQSRQDGDETESRRKDKKDKRSRRSRRSLRKITTRLSGSADGETQGGPGHGKPILDPAKPKRALRFWAGVASGFGLFALISSILKRQ